MARFYGSMQGNRGEATRMGSANSGFSAHIRGWNVGCEVEMSVDDEGRDVCSVYRTEGSDGGGRVLVAVFVEGGQDDNYVHESFREGVQNV